MRARASARHNGSNRHALDLGDLAIAQALQHHQQQRGALFLHQPASARSMSRPPASGPAASGASLSSMGASGGRRARLTQPVTVEVGQDGIEPTP